MHGSNPEFAANHPFLVMAFVTLLALTFFNELKIATQKFRQPDPGCRGAVDEQAKTSSCSTCASRRPVGGKIAKAIQIPATGSRRQTNRGTGKTQGQDAAGLLQDRRAFRRWPARN